MTVSTPLLMVRIPISVRTPNRLHCVDSAMGICTSCDATSTSTTIATAKLILQDGKLRKVPCPLKVSVQLQTNPACFICNSDDLEFDDFVSALNCDDELQPDQLYFELPLSWLKRPLRAEDMAALAVKASAALVRGGARKLPCCGGGVRERVAFSQREYVKAVQLAVAEDGNGRLIEKKTIKGGGGRDRRDRSFAPNLTMILEEWSTAAAAVALAVTISPWLTVMNFRRPCFLGLIDFWVMLVIWVWAVIQESFMFKSRSGIEFREKSFPESNIYTLTRNSIKWICTKG